MKNNLIEFFVDIQNFICDGAMSFLSFLSRKDYCSGELQEVLLIRLDAIGDFILWLDAAAQLRSLYPSDRYRLVLIGNVGWTELAVKMPYFDQVVSVESTRFRYDIKYRFKLWQFLCSRKWIVAIHPTYSRNGSCGDDVVRLSGAVERIGADGDLSNQPKWYRLISNRWYTRLLPTAPEPMMEIERNAEFMRNLGLQGFKSGLPKFAIDFVLPNNFSILDYVVIVPGASLVVKQWPVDRFAEISKRIHQTFGLGVVVCGTANETTLGRRLLELLHENNENWCEDWTGKTSLLEFIAVINNAKAVISNDSSAVHIATSVGTPAVCIVGGGHFGRFVPYTIETETTCFLPVPIFHLMDCFGCNLQCSTIDTSGVGACILWVSVEDVWVRFNELARNCF